MRSVTTRSSGSVTELRFRAGKPALPADCPVLKRTLDVRTAYLEPLHLRRSSSGSATAPPPK